MVNSKANTDGFLLFGGEYCEESSKTLTLRFSIQYFSFYLYKTFFRPKKISGDKEIYLKYAKSRISLSASPKSPTSNEDEKVQKTSLDCATIALKVLKTSIKYQKFRERHSHNSSGQLEAADSGEHHQGA